MIFLFLPQGKYLVACAVFLVYPRINLQFKSCFHFTGLLLTMLKFVPAKNNNKTDLFLEPNLEKTSALKQYESYKETHKATPPERLYCVFQGSSEAFVCCRCCSRRIDWNDCAALEGLNKPFHCSLWHSLNPSSSEATVCNWFPFSLKHFNRKSEAILISFVKLGGPEIYLWLMSILITWFLEWLESFFLNWRARAASYWILLSKIKISCADKEQP